MEKVVGSCVCTNAGVGIGGGHDGLELFQYFSAGCYEGYGDTENVWIKRDPVSLKNKRYLAIR
jgi:hypothetical protein